MLLNYKGTLQSKEDIKIVFFSRAKISKNYTHIGVF